MEQASKRQVPESFTTERLIIRCPRPGDGKAMNEALVESFPTLQRWMPWARELPSVEASEKRAGEAHAAFQAGTDLPLLLLHRETGQIVGSSGLHRMNWEVPRFEIGYWCRTRFEGQGYITEAVKAITRMAFETLGAKRVEIHCSHRNLKSRAVAERAGFALEATLKNHAREPWGELRDTLVFALTAP